MSEDITVAIVLLAAGKAARMGKAGQHKLLSEFDGVPLVRRSAEVAIASGAAWLIVVTGHRSDEIERALSSLPLDIVNNPDFASGIASSLIVGMSAQARAADGVAIRLDTPFDRATRWRRVSV